MNRRYEELCDKITALLHEYHDVIHESTIDPADLCEHGKPPDWNYPLAIQHWALVFAIDDANEDRHHRGYWTFSVIPEDQRRYITRGLLEEWLESFLL